MRNFVRGMLIKFDLSTSVNLQAQHSPVRPAKNVGNTVKHVSFTRVEFKDWRLGRSPGTPPSRTGSDKESCRKRSFITNAVFGPGRGNSNWNSWRYCTALRNLSISSITGASLLSCNFRTFKQLPEQFRSDITLPARISESASLDW